jgi:hypothetical protein
MSKIAERDVKGGQSNKSPSEIEEIRVKNCYSSGKHIVTGVWKRLNFAVLHLTRELIGSHVTRENRIYVLEVLQHASSSEDLLVSRFAAALRHFDFTAPYCFLFAAS